MEVDFDQEKKYTNDNINDNNSISFSVIIHSL